MSGGAERRRDWWGERLTLEGVRQQIGGYKSPKRKARCKDAARLKPIEHGHMRWEARRRLASRLAGKSVYTVEHNGLVSEKVIGKNKNRGERENDEERVAGRDRVNNDKNVRVMGPEFGYDKGGCIEEGNIKVENKVSEIIIHLNENRRREEEMAENTMYWELK